MYLNPLFPLVHFAVHQTATLELNLNDTLVQLELLDAKTKTLTDKLDVAEASKNDAEAKLCVFADKIVRLEADRAADAQRLQFAERQVRIRRGQWW